MPASSIGSPCSRPGHRKPSYVIGVNRTGHEPHYQYSGRSLVADPYGTILADAGEAEGILTATLTAQTVRQWRERFPAYRDFLRWG